MVKIKVLKTCEYCGKDFIAIGYSQKNKKTCSNTCRYALTAQKNIGQTRVDKITKICLVCGKSFVDYESNLQKTCSKKCGYVLVGESTKEHRSGKKWEDFFDSRTVLKMRKSIIERIENGNQINPNFNPKACSIIEDYGNKMGYNFQHAKNGGEVRLKIGRWPDGYDKEKNVVIEVNEPCHYKGGKLKKKDVKRRKEIINYLNCKFIEIKINKSNIILKETIYE